MFYRQLEEFKKNLEKKAANQKGGQRGISQYFDGDSENDDEFSDDENDIDFQDDIDKGMTGDKDPSKLIDLELIKLL